MTLPQQDLELIEDARKLGGFIGNEEKFLSIISKYQKALKQAVDQRDCYILDEYPEEMAFRNIKKNDEEIQAILDGKDE